MRTKTENNKQRRRRGRRSAAASQSSSASPTFENDSRDKKTNIDTPRRTLFFLRRRRNNKKEEQEKLENNTEQREGPFSTNSSSAVPRQQQRSGDGLPSSSATDYRLSRTSSDLRRLAVLSSSWQNNSTEEKKHNKHAKTTGRAFAVDKKTEPSSTCSDDNNNIISSSSSSHHRSNPCSSILSSYLLCGNSKTAYDYYVDDSTDQEYPLSPHSFPHLPDDPTVQESIECVFAHQLETSSQEEGLLSLLFDEKESNENKSDVLISPAGLLQAKSKSRSNEGLLPKKEQSNNKQQLAAGKLIHVGTYDPSTGQLVPPSSPHVAVVEAPPPKASSYKTQQSSIHYSVMCHHCQERKHTPFLPPTEWPQRPLLLRITPHSGMRVLSVRTTSGMILWKPGDQHYCNSDWMKELQKQWGQPPNNTPPTSLTSETCPECLILPINNGNEQVGKSLVVDFESDLFVGTVLVRIRHSNGTTPQLYDDSVGYFANLHRRYQIVITGKFREAVPWTTLAAGMEFQRACGKLPPKWIVKSGLKVLSFFAPQLQARFEGDKPMSLTPLGSTPQMLRVQDSAEANESMEGLQEEPKEASLTLLGEASKAPSSMQRARFRKRNFDKLYVEQSHLPLTDPTKVYTFEFLQHLLNVQDFSIELGSMLGSVDLQEGLDGQPLQIMAKCCMDGRKLWAFDLWHECLYKDSLRHDEKVKQD